MPEVDETDDKECAGNFVISENGYHHTKMNSNFNESSTSATVPDTFSISHSYQTAMLNFTVDILLRHNLSTALPISSLPTLLENTTETSRHLWAGFSDNLTQAPSPAPTTATTTLEYVINGVYNISSTASTTLKSAVDFSNSTANAAQELASLYGDNVTDEGYHIPDVNNNYSHPATNLPVDLRVSSQQNFTSMDLYNVTYSSMSDQVSTVNLSDFQMEFITSSTTRNIFGNSTLSCSRTFILLRRDLKRTQVMVVMLVIVIQYI